jgi:signal transduction histidine kinase/ActR/RegA family two-component response regulator
LDAPTWILGLVSFGITELRTSAIVNGIERAANGMLAVACFYLGVVILRTYFIRHQPRRPVDQESIWVLGGLLLLCGILQVGSALGALPLYHLTGMSLLASVACCAGALSLVPLLRTREVIQKAKGDESDFAEKQRPEAGLGPSDAATQLLAEADARRNEFLAMLGHELRNPLAPIRNAVKVMKQRGSSDPDICWARDVVDHQVRQMAQLVDDLLEISRVISGKVRLQKEAVDVATIVAFATETSRPVLETHHHRLSILLPPESIYIDADPLRMAQVLSNLLNNAAKYTHDGGQVRLSAASDGSQVVLRVRDNGIGIPPEMLSGIFDLFAQVDHSLDHSQGGLGLGLTLVRSLVEMHGGSVRALSKGLGRGSEFVVRLPMMDPSRLYAEPKVTEPEKLAPRREQPRSLSFRVLVVDDNVSSAQSLAKVLKLDGHDVQVTHDGKGAIESVRRFRPEVVLMDIGLPGMDGYEVARQIRADAELAAGIILLAAVTGYAEDEARRRSREAGFDQHLVKPVDPDALLALLASLEWATPATPGEPTAAQASADSIDLIGFS